MGLAPKGVYGRRAIPWVALYASGAQQGIGRGRLRIQ